MSLLKYFALTLLISISASYPILDVGGFSWTENLVFDGNGNLFVSDSHTGILWRISLSPSGFFYQKSPHIAEGTFSTVTGLAMSSNSDILYVIATLKGVHWIIAVNTQTPNTFELLVELPLLGNGLAYNRQAGNLYSTIDGGFIPGKALIYSIDITANQTTTVASHLFGADGAFIDQERGLLYISEVITATVICYEIQSDNTLVEKFQFIAPDMLMLDDFCLSEDGSQIYGADYSNGTIAIFNSDGTSNSSYLLMEGLTNPTSARFSSGPGFNSTCVYLTDGGTGQVLQSPYALHVESFQE